MNIGGGEAADQLVCVLKAWVNIFFLLFYAVKALILPQSIFAIYAHACILLKISAFFRYKCKCLRLENIINYYISINPSKQYPIQIKKLRLKLRRRH